MAIRLGGSAVVCSETCVKDNLLSCLPDELSERYIYIYIYTPITDKGIKDNVVWQM